MLYVPQGYHSGVAYVQDDALHPDLWEGLAWGWDPAAQQGATGKLYDFVRGIPRNFTALASGDWRATEEGILVPVYNGTSFADQTAAALDLTGARQLSITMDLYWDAFANDDDLAFESSANFNLNAGAILCDPNGSTATFNFGPSTGNNLDYNTVSITRPSAAVWHNYLFTVDLDQWATTVPGAVRAVYVDGVEQTMTAVTMSGAAPADFGNHVWNFMCRNVASLFGAGRLGKFLVYRGLKKQEHAERFTQGESPFVRRAVPASRTISLGVLATIRRFFLIRP